MKYKQFQAFYFITASYKKVRKIHTLFYENDSIFSFTTSYDDRYWIPVKKDIVNFINGEKSCLEKIEYFNNNNNNGITRIRLVYNSGLIKNIFLNPPINIPEKYKSYFDKKNEI